MDKVIRDGKVAVLTSPGYGAGGAEQLVITWLPEGTAFRVEEYDGSESLILLDDLRLTA